MAANGSNMALSVLMRAVDNLSAPVRRMQGRLAGFRRQAEAVSRRVGFDRLAASLTRAGRATGDLYRGAQRVGRRLAMVGALGAASIAGITHATAAGGDELGKFSDQVGMQAQELQEWQYAAERMGITQDRFNSSLESFVRRLGDARAGQGELYSRLRDSNPQLLQQLTNARDTGEALEIYMQALEGSEDRLERNQLAAAAFTRQGMQMSRMVREGMEELRAMRDRASEFGHVMSDEAIAQSEKFSDQMLDMRKTMQGVRNTIGGALMPVFGDLMDRLSVLVIEHQPAIREWAETFAERLPGRLERLRAEFDQLITTLQPVAAVASDLVDRFGAVNVAAAALGLMVGAPLIVPALKLSAALLGVGAALVRVTASLTVLALKAVPPAIKALWAVGGVVVSLARGLMTLAMRAIPLVAAGLRALGAAALANPVVAIVTAIAAGAALLIANWDTVGPWFRDLWDGFVGHVQSAWEAVENFLGFDPLDVVSDLWGGLTDYIGDVTNAVKRLVNGDWSALMDIFNLSPLGAIRNAFGEVVDFLGDMDWAKHGRAMIDTLVQGIKDMAGAPADALRGALSSARDLLPFSDARTGPFSALTASGAAIPETLAGGVDRGEDGFVRSMHQLVGRAREALGQAPGPAANDGPSVLSMASPSAQGASAGGSAGAARGGVVVHRVDFRPSITIQAGSAQDAQAIADIVDERMERWSTRDLWVQVQSVGEATG